MGGVPLSAYPPVFAVEGDEPDQRPAVEGELPAWLAGTFMTVGPAAFDVGGRPVAHWLDGHGRILRVSIEGGEALADARFLSTRTREVALGRRQVREAGFGTGLRAPWWETFGQRDILGDNANVALADLADRLVALGETASPAVVHPATLEMLHTLALPQGEIETTHPVGSLNVATRVRKPTGHLVVEWTAEGTRRIVARLPSPSPSYVHSFAATPEHVVLVESPMVFESRAPKGAPLRARLAWRPERAVRFTVVDRATGAVAATATGPAFFHLHHVSAARQGDDVVVDLVAHQDAGVLDALGSGPLSTGRVGRLTGRLWRCKVPLRGGFVETARVCEEGIEFPAVNASRRRPLARYVWGLGNDRSRSDGHLDQLVRIDAADGAAPALLWREPGAWPGPPVFAPRPGATAEDDGVLLSPVFHAQEEASSLLVLDGASMTEVARVWLPFPSPFPGHGMWLAAQPGE